MVGALSSNEASANARACVRAAMHVPHACGPVQRKPSRTEATWPTGSGIRRRGPDWGRALLRAPALTSARWTGLERDGVNVESKRAADAGDTSLHAAACALRVSYKDRLAHGLEALRPACKRVTALAQARIKPPRSERSAAAGAPAAHRNVSRTPGSTAWQCAYPVPPGR